MKIFISYSKFDREYREQLERRLKVIGRDLPLVSWSDEKLRGGDLVHCEIQDELETADIVLLLISSDFMATDYCYDIELPKALESFKQKKNLVIPIIIREEESWKSTVIGDFTLGDLTALPPKGIPMEDWQSPDKFWSEIQKGIREHVSDLLNQQ